MHAGLLPLAWCGLPDGAARRGHGSCTPCRSVTRWMLGRAASRCAGSARTGSSASSAAPSSGASTPSLAGTISTSARARRQGATVELGLDGRGDERMEQRQAPAEHDARRVEHVDEPGEADARATPDLGERGERGRRRRRRRRRGPPRPRRCPPSGGRPARTSSASSPTSVSQQPTEPHRQVDAGERVDGQVPDLAAVAGDARQRAAADDHPAADADLAGEEDRRRRCRSPHRAGARRGRRGRPRWRRTIGAGGRQRAGQQPRRAARRASRGSERSTRSRRPAGRHRRRPRRSRRGRRCATCAAAPSASSARSATMSSGARAPAGPLDADEVEDVTAHADDGHGEGVDGDLERQHDGAAAGRGGRAATGRPGRPSDSPALLDDESGGDEVADEPADAAAGQPGALAELRPRQRPLGVQHPDERAEVGPPDRSRCAAPCPPGHHRICAPRVQTSVTRISASSGAACQGREAATAVVQSARAGARPSRWSAAVAVIVVAAGCWRRSDGPAAAAPRTSSPTAAGSTTATRATSSTSSAAAWPRSTATTTAAASCTSPAAARRRRCTTTRARPAGRCASRRLPSPVTDLTAVTGAYPLDVDSDGHTDLAVLRVGEDVVLRGLGDCRFERANEALGLDGGDTWTVAFSATWEGAERPADAGVRRLPRAGSPVVRGQPAAATGGRRRRLRRADRPLARLLHAVDAVQRLEPHRAGATCG